MTNVGDVTSPRTPSPAPSPCVSVVFPAPRSPVRITRSPAAQLRGETPAQRPCGRSVGQVQVEGEQPAQLDLGTRPPCLGVPQPGPEPHRRTAAPRGRRAGCRPDHVRGSPPPRRRPSPARHLFGGRGRARRPDGGPSQPPSGWNSRAAAGAPSTSASRPPCSASAAATLSAVSSVAVAGGSRGDRSPNDPRITERTSPARSGPTSSTRFTGRERRAWTAGRP